MSEDFEPFPRVLLAGSFTILRSHPALDPPVCGSGPGEAFVWQWQLVRVLYIHTSGTGRVIGRILSQ